MIRARLNSGDADLRGLERQLAAGDPSAAGPLAVAMIRATGELDPAWVESLLGGRAVRGGRGDPAALVAADQTLRQSKLTSPLYRAYGSILSSRISWAAAGSVLTWIPPFVQTMLPDCFGRPQGLILHARLHGEGEGRPDSSYTFRHLARERLGASAALDRLDVPQPWVSVTATLTFNRNAHPWYFRLYRNTSDHQDVDDDDVDAHLPGRQIARRGRDTILLSELRDGPADAFPECVEAAMNKIDEQIEHVEALLHRVRDVWGVRVYADALCFSDTSNSPRDVRLALMSVTPPLLGAWISQPQNASGGAMCNAALQSLAAWLMAPPHRAGVDFHLPDPFSLEASSYPFVSGSLDLLSRRSARSQHPLRVQAYFDPLVGAWARTGDGWLGNQYPPQGEWKIHLYDRVPATTQAYAQAVQWWLKEHLPYARVLVGHDGGWRHGGGEASWRQVQ